ncbi:helix-turn-helix domain-containing protein [Nannocystaceae bacterium ST9]
MDSEAGLKLGSDDEAPLPGAYIRAQRKRLGMSLDQLAALTKIPRRQLEALEDDRYGDLPGLVFVKGFLRCCARALDLDPDAVIGMLYESEREQLRAKRRENSGVGLQVPASFKRGRGNQASRWLATQLDRLPSAQILMWLIVALIVALIVLAAFTLASGQAGDALQIRS